MPFEGSENFVCFVVTTLSNEETRRIWEERTETPNESCEDYFRSAYRFICKRLKARFFGFK
jgi:hypothetical protein